MTTKDPITPATFRLEMTNYAATNIGAAWVFPRIRHEERYQRYYDNYLSELFQGPARSTNGLKALVDPSDKRVHTNDIIRLNWFKAITDFYVQGYFGDRPALTSTDKARQTWIQENAGELFEALELASRWLSIKGWFTVLTQSMHPRVMAVDGTAYWPIRYEYSLEHTRAHLIAYRYYERGENESYLVHRIPNRIKFVIYDPENGMNLVRIHQLSGYTVGELLLEQEAGVTGVFSVGRGDSDYGPVESPIRDLMVHRAIQAKVITDTSNPHLVAPDIVGHERERMQKEGIPQDAVLFKDQLGTPWEYLTYTGPLKDSLAFTDTLKQSIYTLSSVPPTAFGEVIRKDGSGSGSGVAISRLMHAALTKVKKFRLKMEILIPKIMDGMGAPPGTTSLKWVADPWASDAERTAHILAMRQAKLITVAEARAQMEYEPDPEVEALLEAEAAASSGTGSAGPDKDTRPEYSQPSVGKSPAKSPGRPPQAQQTAKEGDK